MSVVQVASWPRLRAQVNDNASALVWVTHTATALRALSVERVRVGVLTQAVQVAKRLSRAVVVEVADPEGSFTLAVTPVGVVVEYVTAAAQVDVDDALLPVQGPCRRCTTLTSIAVATCVVCGVHSPTGADADLRLEVPSTWGVA